MEKAYFISFWAMSLDKSLTDFRIDTDFDVCIRTVIFMTCPAKKEGTRRHLQKRNTQDWLRASYVQVTCKLHACHNISISKPLDQSQTKIQ